MKYVATLVCLNPPPTAQPLSVSEYTFYKAINTIAAVKNVKLISRTAPYKALVQLETKEAAELVISQLHNSKTDIGRFKVFASNKTYISLEKTLKQVIEEGLVSENEGRRGTHEFESEEHGFVPKHAHMGTKRGTYNLETMEVIAMPSERDRVSSMEGPQWSEEHSREHKMNKMNARKKCSEIIVRGAKSRSSGTTSVYVKTDGLNKSVASDIVQLANAEAELLGAELEISQNVLFLDLKCRADAERVVTALNGRPLRGHSLTAQTCPHFEQLLDASVNSRSDTAHNLSNPRRSAIKSGCALVLESPVDGMSVESLVLAVGKLCPPTRATEYRSKVHGERVLLVEYASEKQANWVLEHLHASRLGEHRALARALELRSCSGLF